MNNARPPIYTLANGDKQILPAVPFRHSSGTPIALASQVGTSDRHAVLPRRQQMAI